jgi:hypothetical protein
MKTKLLKKVRKEFELYQIEKLDYSNYFQIDIWITLGRPKDFFVYYNKVGLPSYHSSLNKAYNNMLIEIKHEYSWIKKGSGKYKKIFF